MEKDYTGTITGHVRSRDFLEGDWGIDTQVVEKADGSWEAEAMNGQYKTEGMNATHAMERLYEQLYKAGLKGEY